MRHRLHTLSYLRFVRVHLWITMNHLMWSSSSFSERTSCGRLLLTCCAKGAHKPQDRSPSKTGAPEVEAGSQHGAIHCDDWIFIILYIYMYILHIFPHDHTWFLWNWTGRGNVQIEEGWVWIGKMLSGFTCNVAECQHFIHLVWSARYKT